MSEIIGLWSRHNHKKLIKNKILESLNNDYYVLDSFRNQKCFFGIINKKQGRIEKKINQKNNNMKIVVFGEIYNDDVNDLAGFILSLYKDGELNRLQELNGSFVAAIYDNSRDKLTIVNDRYGLIQLYYYHDDHIFYISSKIKFLMDFDVKKSLRKDALVDFFIFGYLLGEKTFFQNIFQLPSASILEVSKDGLNLSRYWDYQYDEKDNLKSKDELADKLGMLWQQSVERRINTDEKIIIPLSGGLDSRAILAAALECTNIDNITTFTFGEKGSFDYEIGKMVADKAGVRNISLMVEKGDFEYQYHLSIEDVEGMIDGTPYFPIQSYQHMRNNGKKIFSGYMGGELMGSHITLRMMKKKMNTIQNLTEAENIILDEHKLNDLDDIKQLFNPDYIDLTKLRKSFTSTCNELKQIQLTEMANFCALWDYKHRQHRYIPNAIFRYKNYFQYVTPFLDNDLVDFILKIPPELRLDKKLYTSMLLSKYPIYFKLPTKNTCGLPLNTNNILFFIRRIITYSKRKVNRISSVLLHRNMFLDKNLNYIDYNDLLRRNKEYNTFIREKLDKVMEREFFNRNYLGKMWNLHMKGKKNYAMMFGLLVTFEMFLEKFIDK